MGIIKSVLIKVFIEAKKKKKTFLSISFEF